MWIIEAGHRPCQPSTSPLSSSRIGLVGPRHRPCSVPEAVAHGAGTGRASWRWPLRRAWSPPFAAHTGSQQPRLILAPTFADWRAQQATPAPDQCQPPEMPRGRAERDGVVVRDFGKPGRLVIAQAQVGLQALDVVGAALGVVADLDREPVGVTGAVLVVLRVVDEANLHDFHVSTCAAHLLIDPRKDLSCVPNACL